MNLHCSFTVRKLITWEILSSPVFPLLHSLKEKWPVETSGRALKVLQNSLRPQTVLTFPRVAGGKKEV